jgi:hypothetical protein
MELPQDVIQIIHEFSKPVTRPDWRTLHRLPYHVYKDDFYTNYEKRINKFWNSGMINQKSIFTGYNVISMFQ